MATVWRDGAVARATLEESLLLDAAPPARPRRPRVRADAGRRRHRPRPRRPAPRAAPPEIAGAAAGERLVACRDCAVVECRSRAVEVPTGPAYAGAVAGGIVGALFGEQIGKAHERHVTSSPRRHRRRVLGHGVQRAATRRTWYDAALRLPNGALQVRRYDAPPPFRVASSSASTPWPALRLALSGGAPSAAETSTGDADSHPGQPGASGSGPVRRDSLLAGGACRRRRDRPAAAGLRAGGRLRLRPGPALHRSRFSHRGPAVAVAAGALSRPGGGCRRGDGARPSLFRRRAHRRPRRERTRPGGDRRCARPRRPGPARATESGQRAACAALRQQQREGAELRAIADAIAAIEADLQPFVERFQLTGADAAGPRPLGCAARWAEAALAAPGAPTAARANGVLLLAAALDGRHEVEGLAGATALPEAAGVPSCAPELPRRSWRPPATLMADARQSAVRARKNEAMRELMQTAGLQWAGALGLGYLLMLASRRRVDPALGVALSLAAWAAAAWLARVPWPLAGGRGFDPGRVDVAWDSRPATWVLTLAGAAFLALVVALLRRRDPVLDAASRRRR